MSKQEFKLASVKKSSRMAKRVSSVLAWFMVAATTLCVAGAGLLMALQDKINPVLAVRPDSVHFTNPEIHGILSLRIDLNAMITSGEYAQAASVCCIFGAVMCAITAAILFLITKALGKMEGSASPFNDDVLSLLKKAFIGLTVVSGLFSGLGAAVVIGLSLWCVYCIMDYGCALQEEVDDTI